MKYKIKNRTITIPDKEIINFQKEYSITQEEAIKLWLEDNDYLKNEEIELLTKQAKENKVSRQAYTIKEKSTEKKTRTVKISDEKQALFKNLVSFLTSENYNFSVITENKLIEIKVDNKTFKLDLIEKRLKK